MHTESFLPAASLVWQVAGVGVQRQILGYNQDLMMVKVRFQQGAVGQAHHHPHTQTSYIVSGRFKVTIGEQSSILSAGDGYFVQSNQPHGCICLEAGELIDVFSPCRTDFL